MVLISFLTTAVFALSGASGQLPSHNSLESLSVTTTIPVAFTKNIDADHAHAGDPVVVKTTQVVKLGNGQVIPAGAEVIGHVVATSPFIFDRTPYARQKQAQLAIHFDSIVNHGQQLQVSVYVRAMADPIASWEAVEPPSADDTLVTLTQVGGDQLTPSQSEVLSRDGDVVAYQRHGGVFAHLIASRGNSPDGCDSTDTEQSMKIFSASACGLYGFTDVSLVESGRRNATGTFVLQSRRSAPKIWKHSNALLEVISPTISVAGR